MSGEPTDYCEHCGNDVDSLHPCGCFDACRCGDYRHQHKDGRGPCVFNGRGPDACHGNEDCMKFESVTAPSLVDWRNSFRT